MPVITMTTDFGEADEWVAACKGVILGILPEAMIIDITHKVPSYDIRRGSIVLAGAAPYMPEGSVHIGIVDPEVGTARTAIAIMTARGDVLIGPDNGLLIPAAGALGGITAAVSIENERYMLRPVSATFHGRDVFAPVAARVAAGLDIGELGPAIWPEELIEAPWAPAESIGETLEAEVIDIDKFGSVKLNVDEGHLATIGAVPGRSLALFFRDQIWVLPVCRTFSDVEPGEGLLLLDSAGFLAVSLNKRNAAEKFGLNIGDPVWLSVSPEPTGRVVLEETEKAEGGQSDSGAGDRD